MIVIKYILGSITGLLVAVLFVLGIVAGFCVPAAALCFILYLLGVI